jgi:transcriptional regulator with XRE-family HTH domain
LNGYVKKKIEKFDELMKRIKNCIMKTMDERGQIPEYRETGPHKENAVKDRLAKIRKALQMNQEEFAERLGMTGRALSMIEVGTNLLTEKNIKFICMTFNVNEHWLRTGEGELFTASPYYQEFFEIYQSLMPETQQALLNFARQLLKIQKKTVE